MGIVIDAAGAGTEVPAGEGVGLVAGLRRGWQRLTCWLLLAGATVLHLANLNHTYVAPWDEAFHAVVAEHLAQHPLRPTLYETAALSGQLPGGTSWEGSTHIWLHIQPLGMWAAALSMRLFGETPLALRLPGALFVALGMWATYALGQRLFGGPAGLVGAAFVGFAPYGVLISQGYAFGDITDTPLLLLTPLAVLGLVVAYRTGRWRWLVMAGATQGLCYLAKGGLGLAPVGAALALAIAEWRFPPEAEWRRLGVRGPALFLAVAVAVAAPYNVYLAAAFPAEYALEGRNWAQAFFGSYEGWGRPPDYHATMYLFAMYGSALALLLVCAAVAVGVVALRRRSRAELVVAAWVAALYLPLSLAVTKSVPMTLPAVPALGLAVGRVVELGLGARPARQRAATLGLLIGTAVAALVFLLAGVVLPGLGLDMTYHHPSMLILPPPPLALRLAPYALEAECAAVAAVVCGALLGLGRPSLRRLGERLRARSRGRTAGTADTGSAWASVARAVHGLKPVGHHGRNALEGLHHASLSGPDGAVPAGRRERMVTRIALAGVVLLLAVYWARDDLQSAGETFSPTPAAALGTYVKAHTPANATVLMTGNDTFEVDGTQVMNARVMVMFWAHRDVYAIGSTAAKGVCSLVAGAARAGSPVVVLTDQPFAGAPLGGTAGWRLYRPACG